MFGLSADEKMRWWQRREQVSRALFHRFADKTYPGEARLWLKLSQAEQREWIDRAEAHCKRERTAGRELPYG